MNFQFLITLSDSHDSPCQCAIQTFGHWQQNNQMHSPENFFVVVRKTIDSSYSGQHYTNERVQLCVSLNSSVTLSRHGIQYLFLVLFCWTVVSRTVAVAPRMLLIVKTRFVTTYSRNQNGDQAIQHFAQSEVTKNCTQIHVDSLCG